MKLIMLSGSIVMVSLSTRSLSDTIEILLKFDTGGSDDSVFGFDGVSVGFSVRSESPEKGRSVDWGDNTDLGANTAGGTSWAATSSAASRSVITDSASNWPCFS